MFGYHDRLFLKLVNFNCWALPAQRQELNCNFLGYSSTLLAIQQSCIIYDSFKCRILQSLFDVNILPIYFIYIIIICKYCPTKLNYYYYQHYYHYY